MSSMLNAREHNPALDHLRWIAAMLVVTQHARGFLMVGYDPRSDLLTKAFYFVTGFSHTAVVIFFVLSGYLVGGKALRLIVEGCTSNQRDRFIIDRFARIFIVLWPALLLAAMVALLAPQVPVLTTENWAGPNPAIASHNDPAGWMGTAFMLNETLTATVQFNGPLWSLAYEWIYYVIAAGGLYIVNRDTSRMAMSVVVYAIVLITLCALKHPAILAMMVCWLMGAAASRLRPVAPAWLTLPIFLASAIYVRLTEQSLGTDLLVSAATSALLLSTGLASKAVFPRAGAWLSGFSFSLYAIHVPVMVAFVCALQSFGLFIDRQQASTQTYLWVALLIASSYAAAIVFASLTETRTSTVRDLIVRIYTRGRERQEEGASQ